MGCSILLTADDAQKITENYEQKSWFYKLRLAWYCGKINKSIEKAANDGEYRIKVLVKTKKTWDAYIYKIIELYRDLGYKVEITPGIFWKLIISINWGNNDEKQE